MTASLAHVRIGEHVCNCQMKLLFVLNVPKDMLVRLPALQKFFWLMSFDDFIY